jgi:hypothetical protein
MFERLFYTETSPQSWQKKALLREHRVVCLDQRNEPTHRMSWEAFQTLVADHKQHTLEEMRAAQERAHLAGEFEKLDVISPEQVFSTSFAEGILPQALPGYMPEHGFDLDIILVADDELAPVYHVEIFPRARGGEMVRNYGSIIQYSAPFRSFQGKTIQTDLAPILFGACNAAGDSIYDAGTRWVKLLQTHGQWKVSYPDSVRHFVHCACFSLIESFSDESQPVVAAGVTRSIDGGANRKADMFITRSK